MWTPRIHSLMPSRPSSGPASPVRFRFSHRWTANGTADLVIIGGGFTGLWAAIEAKQRDPGRDVVLLEMEQIAFGATGRNGGFMEPSMTHGLENGLASYSPGEMRELIRLGNENYAEIAEFIRANQIDCDLQEHGVIWAATAPYLAEAIPESWRCIRNGVRTRFPCQPRSCGPRSTRPSTSAGSGRGMRAGWSIRPGWPGACCGVALELGVRVHEQTRVTGLVDAGSTLAVRTARRLDPRAKGLARDQRLPGRDSRDPAIRRAGLRLRADERAADRGATGGDRLADPVRPERWRQPVRLSPDDRRQPDPLRRMGRRLSIAGRVRSVV